MNLFGVLEMSGSALGAERWRAEVVAANMANAETTRTARAAPTGGRCWCSGRSRCRGFRCCWRG